jgi:hypothetical protein
VGREKIGLISYEKAEGHTRVHADETMGEND